MDPSETSGAVSLRGARRHPLINHNFTLLWSGQTISVLGDFIFNTTLVVWVAVVLTRGQAWTTPAVSGIFLASSLPTILLGPVAWLSLEEADNDPLRFLSYLMAALTRMSAGSEERDAALPITPRGTSWEEVLTSFVNDLACVLVRDTVLVLDDYHLMTAEPIHAALRFLIEHAPSHLHLLIGTRVDPPLPLARLRARSQLSEMRVEELRFAPPEVQAFLQAMELDLTPDLHDALEQRTQGWIVGIQLLALALRGQAQPATLLQTQPGAHPFFLEYVSEELLARLPAEDRRFLLRTSILDRMTGALCEAVTGLSHGQRRLADLYRQNLLIYLLDDTGT